MRKITKLITFIAIFAVSVFGADATMEVVKHTSSAPKIMLEDGTGGAFDSTFKSRFFKMLVGDLKVTTNFNPVEAYVSNSYDAPPVRSVGNENPSLILQYKLMRNGSKIDAKVKLITASTGELRSEKMYSIAGKSSYPFLSHNIIVDINKKLNMPPVDWMRRYVLMSKSVRAKNSEIVIADYTLTFQKTLVSGGLNLFPKWANNSQTSFYYTSYSDRVPTLYKVDRKTGSKTKITSSQGMLVASDVSKDGRKLLLTMAPNGQTDIYEFNLATKHKKRVTFYKGIDVNGGYIDNDRRIVFVSDRLGYPNIFAKSINGRGVERMVYHGRNNNASTSYGNYIVYSSRDKASEFGPRTFNLYLISTKTDYIRQLTATGKNLFPRFSIDGESILFIKNYGRQSALGVIRLKENKTFHFPLQVGQIQSIDW